MAKAKKPAKKKTVAKKATKPTKSTAPKRKATRKSIVALTAADRQSTLKPPEGFEDIVDHTVSAWKTHKSVVRIDKRSPAQLARLLVTAKRDLQKEEAFHEKYDEQLRRIVDARMVSSEAVWGQTLDVYRVVKALVPINPELEEAFSEIADAFARTPAKKDDGAGGGGGGAT